MDKDFLGVGVSFPFRIENGKVAWSQYEESIRESIMIILGTAIGERVMRPDFGCALHDLVFSVNDTSTATLAEFYVEEALKKWEPRIEVINVVARSDSNEHEMLNINVEYRDISTNNRYNLVYPFYLGRE